MSEIEKLEILKQMFVTDGSDGSQPISDDTLFAYLRNAGSIVINKAYPFRSDIREVPDKYSMNQIEIAVYLLSKKGAEGEVIHNENGVYRTYEAADVPPSMLNKIPSRVKFI